jgi:hypothetical protein
MFVDLLSSHSKRACFPVERARYWLYKYVTYVLCVLWLWNWLTYFQRKDKQISSPLRNWNLRPVKSIGTLRYYIHRNFVVYELRSPRFVEILNSMLWSVGCTIRLGRQISTKAEPCTCLLWEMTPQLQYHVVIGACYLSANARPAVLCDLPIFD